MNLEEIDKEVKKAVKLIRKGYQREFILEKIKERVFSKEKIFEMAKCRIKAKKKFGELANKLFFDEEGLRYSTPPIIAEYRAKRIDGNSITDVSCGVGIQLIYFSKKAKATGIEIDRDRAKMAILNAIVFGKDVEIIIGDALSKEIYEKIDADCIFSDPSRKEKEERRTFSTLFPNPAKIYEIYSKKTDKIAFELPPQIERKEIKLQGEKEYTSLDFRLNRLALYTGSLASCDVSAISLPSEERVTNLDEKIVLEKINKPMDFLYEVDNTIIKADLLENLTGKLSFNGKILHKDKRRTLLTSCEEYKSSFLRKYEVEKICNFNLNEINKWLKKLKAGKATLRFRIKPEKYWKIRNKIEEGLKGEKHFYIFKVNEKAIIAFLATREVKENCNYK